MPLSAPCPSLAIVDDDPAICDALNRLFFEEGYRTCCYTNSRHFVEHAPELNFQCVLLDVYMPDLCGFDVLKRIEQSGFQTPVIMMSAQGHIALAVQAIKAGAVDFIEKPFNCHTLMQSVQNACQQNIPSKEFLSSLTCNHLNVYELTCREKEVLAHLIKGQSNKQTGRCLNISPRTVEVHRARIMEKMNVHNLAELLIKAIEQ